MKVIENRVISRRKNYDYYHSSLADFSNISLLEDIRNVFTNRWLTCILTDSYKEREKIRLTLEHSNIESKPLWKPLHLQPVFSKFLSYSNGISENLFKKGLCLPSGSNLTNNDLKKIVSTIKQVDYIKSSFF